MDRTAVTYLEELANVHSLVTSVLAQKLDYCDGQVEFVAGNCAWGPRKSWYLKDALQKDVLIKAGPKWGLEWAVPTGLCFRRLRGFSLGGCVQDRETLSCDIGSHMHYLTCISFLGVTPERQDCLAYIDRSWTTDCRTWNATEYTTIAEEKTPLLPFQPASLTLPPSYPCVEGFVRVFSLSAVQKRSMDMRYCFSFS